MSKQFTAFVIWGEEPDEGSTPTRYDFATDAEREAFLLGVSEADGWLGATVVDGPDYIVNDDGDIVDANGNVYA